jgi:hypothetical protein
MIVVFIILIVVCALCLYMALTQLFEDRPHERGCDCGECAKWAAKRRR